MITPQKDADKQQPEPENSPDARAKDIQPVDEKPAGKQPKEQKDEVFEPGTEG
jgi:hypothetical protein